MNSPQLDSSTIGAEVVATLERLGLQHRPWILVDGPEAEYTNGPVSVVFKIVENRELDRDLS